MNEDKSGVAIFSKPINISIWPVKTAANQSNYKREIHEVGAINFDSADLSAYPGYVELKIKSDDPAGRNYSLIKIKKELIDVLQYF